MPKALSLTVPCSDDALGGVSSGASSAVASATASHSKLYKDRLWRDHEQAAPSLTALIEIKR